ncbi:hypothetical protein Bhyg_04768 [Pseudolycoriella hygida]|uniref:F-box domain-containing protein n=1 Tax=Pseudolycoriella hygida TaxID=35572 RepID=A0A9Q0NFU3_9DIPT|nr:hypothetical protein Bhyg_04768 [Pseudolycoriella hygida]
MAAHKPELNILHLNDDCLIRIFNFLSLVDLCTTAEVCTHFKKIAGAVFESKHKHFKIPTIGVEFSDNQRILKHFGHLITSSSFSKHNLHVNLNKGQVNLIFEWLGKYCTETLEQFDISGMEDCHLPPTAITFLPKVKSIEFCYLISSEDLKAALDSCKNLVTLKLRWYNGPFLFANCLMPHLKVFQTDVRVNRLTDFIKIDAFFKNHTQLTVLCTRFLNNRKAHYAVDLSFLSHLSYLRILHLTLDGSNVSGTASLSHLNHLLNFSVDCSYDKKTDSEILDRLGSVESLVTFEFKMPDVSHVLRGIERFKNLTNLRIFGDGIVDISSLAQLCSNCIQLVVSCKMLAEPKSLVDVIRNLKKLEKIELRCQVALSETVCEDLAKVCSSQYRKIVITIYENLLAKVDLDFSFIEKFNENNGRFVDIRFYSK